MGGLKSRRVRKFWKAPINRRLDVYDYRYKTSFPYMSGDTFRILGEVIIDKSNFQPTFPKKDGALIVFVMQTRGGNHIKPFFEKTFGQIDQPIILITHNGMTPDWSLFEKYLDDEKLLAWYGKNLVYSHPKTHTLPLGVINQRDPHERGRSPEYWNNLRASKPDKDILCYVNIGVGHKRQARYQNRLDTVNYFNSLPFTTCVGERSWDKYASEMSRSKFVIAPPGEALDTFRLWESLYLGAIPIVTSTPLDPLYKNYPVWVVDDWEEITEEKLNSKWEELSSQFDNCPQLWASWWYKKILSHL